MRYMFLIYSVEASETSELVRRATVRHRAVMNEAQSRGVMRAADPLKPTSMATTVRRKQDKPFVTDGPFADTKEQLAGYYILECRDLDEAIEWAEKIPHTCRGDEGCVEIRPIQEMQARP
jgi:hypothetical protein